MTDHTPEPDGFLSLALGLIEDTPSHEHHHELNDQQANDRAFEAAMRAYEDDEDDEDDLDDPLHSPRFDSRDLIEHHDASAPQDPDDFSLSPPAKREQHDEEEDDWSEELPLIEPHGWWATLRAWVRARLESFVDCPWRGKSYLQLLILLLMVSAVVSAAVYFSDKQRRDGFQDWTREQGAKGYLVFAAAIVFANLPFGFGFIGLVTMCGLLYSLMTAVAIVTVGVTLGITVCYYVTVFLLRESFEHTVAKSRKLQVLVYAARSNGPKLSCLIRFIPIPVGIQTGVLAVANIRAYVAVLCSVVALQPELLLVLYFANRLAAAGETEENAWDTPHIVMYVVGAVVVVGVLVILFWMGKKALQQASEQMDREQNVLEAEMQELGSSTGSTIDLTESEL